MRTAAKDGGREAPSYPILTRHSQPHSRSTPLNDQAHGKVWPRYIWNIRGYDFNIDRKVILYEKLEYWHKNPSTRELVNQPDQWRWSSYRFYEFGDEDVLKMDWDGRWPVAW